MCATMLVLRAILLLVCAFNVHSQDTCHQNGGTSCSEDKEQYSKYSEETNEDARYLKLIGEASKSYKPCTFKNCSCYTSVIDADLQPFKDGISLEMIEKIKDKGTRYQVIDHKLYRDPKCMFPARCAGVEHFLKLLLPVLPDLDFVVNTRDWPQVNRYISSPLPVFSFSKTSEYFDIMYPAWAFWEGGPAIKLYPKGLGRWDERRKELRQAAEQWPWQKKLPRGFFRGSRTSAERDALILLSRKYPDFVDASYTRNQAWKSDADTLGKPPAEEIALVDHCKYRYLFNFRGVAASFRFKHLFLCGSLVFHVGDEWVEFFYGSMEPWVHFIPVPASADQIYLLRLLNFVKRNDKIASAIAKQGQEHIWEHLDMKQVVCYWRRLLKRYARLLKFKPQLDKSLTQIK